MREGCSCGAWVRGRRKDVLTWRAEHACPDRPNDDITQVAGAQVENAAYPESDGMEARIGFQRETW